MKILLLSFLVLVSISANLPAVETQDDSENIVRMVVTDGTELSFGNSKYVISCKPSSSLILTTFSCGRVDIGSGYNLIQTSVVQTQKREGAFSSAFPAIETQSVQIGRYSALVDCETKATQLNERAERLQSPKSR